MAFRKNGITLFIAIILSFSLLLAGCSSNNDPGSAGGSTNKPESEDKGESVNKEEPVKKEEEVKQVKLRVMIYDRGNTPEGMKLTEAPLVKWAQEQVKPLGIDLEMVGVPRGEAESKLNVWLASGEAPDIIYSYDSNTLFKYAEQGGLWELDELLEKYGSQIKTNNQKALDLAGVYKGKRYAIPAIRANPFGGPTIKIRQDWLDKLNMKAPTTADELYTVLKAFKEKDPGNVGKDKVVPYAFPAIGKAFMYNLSGAFGVSPQLVGNGTDMYGGVWLDGKYVSNIASPGARDMFKFLNKLYKEGLIPKEFGTDVNNQQFNQYIAQGVAGFMENNDSSLASTDSSRGAVPEARWVPVEPLIGPDGKRYAAGSADYGMLIMVPKASKEEQAIAAMKYLNWMADPDVILTMQSGIEGVHRKKAEDGSWENIDQDKTAKEVAWYAGPGDLSLIQQGQPKMTYEQLKNAAIKSEVFDPEYYATTITNWWKIFETYTPKHVILSEPRPFAQKNQDTIAKFINESITKIIVSSDPDKEYDAMIAGWKKLGGEEFDRELTEIYTKINYQP
ncbi:extracellular solute-binding protein [Paenibacillus spongiae]|uniref:Extracellular solute-binding protein n=1 Tax=Paenibacillus spongiae TaxID=2909671 RepID=A0ABY5SH67_9BACL|nr:extracellular solute-binding protein [Paenibacillus spongiae]UVI32810.1 extracellular solute-binding protein [Paenibacillus spongiae]